LQEKYRLRYREMNSQLALELQALLYFFDIDVLQVGDDVVKHSMVLVAATYKFIDSLLLAPAMLNDAIHCNDSRPSP